jgi:farnesyl-diphosphate farnesyltransferase
MIGIITALPEELAPLLRRTAVERTLRIGRHRCHVGSLSGRPVVLMAGGDGLARAEESAAALLQQFDLTLLIGAGIAGALVPELGRNTVIVARKVIAPDGTETNCHPVEGANAILRSVERMAADKSALSASGAHAIDTESAGWARAAARMGVPFTVVRAIFDALDDDIPPFVAAATHADGTIDRSAVVRHALLRPSSIPTLLGLRRRMLACCTALADFTVRLTGELPAVVRAPASDAHLDELLTETSRTFALCIPLLRDATRLQVTIAYLLFRIADTFEDASHWPVAERLAALDEFCALLGGGRTGVSVSEPPSPDARRTGLSGAHTESDAVRLAAAWCEKRPSPHAGYMRLIDEVPLVMRAFAALPAEARDIIREHVIRSAQGMAHFVALTEVTPQGDRLQLHDMQQLRDYCYAVAGIVGEMLTELFLLRAPQLRSAAPYLRARAATFGEALQLVNILKDTNDDFSEGRSYVPRDVDRADVIALARADLESATEYTLALQSGDAPLGIVAFAALPVALAEATLDKLERAGAGAKIGRAEVFRISRHVNQSVARGVPPLRPRAQRMRSLFSTINAWVR